MLEDLGSVSRNYLHKDEKMTFVETRFPRKMLYDQTHDNEVLPREQLLGVNAATAMLHICTGSTLGVDQFYPERVPVTTCALQYPLRLTQKETWLEATPTEALITYRAGRDRRVAVAGAWAGWAPAMLIYYDGSKVHATKLRLDPGTY